MKKTKVDTSKGPSPHSIRSKRRASRGFKSVALSTRKGRRNAERIAVKCNINDSMQAPGTKIQDKSTRKMSSFMQTAGGGNDYH